jgi:hypothetical protein
MAAAFAVAPAHAFAGAQAALSSAMAAQHIATACPQGTTRDNVKHARH